MLGWRLRMAVRMVGSPVGTNAVLLAFPLGRAAARGVAAGGSGALSAIGNGDTPIWNWGSEVVVLVLETLWWNGGAIERKLHALSPKTATLTGTVFFLKTSSWCFSPCQGSG